MDEPRYGWVVVWGAFFSLAVIFGISYSFAAFFESFAREFAARRADVSLAFGVCGLIYFALGAAAGMLADRFGPRVVVAAGMLCIAGGLLATSLASSMIVVYLAYGLAIGVGIGLVYAPAIASVQPWFTKRRGLAAGIASSGIGAGTLIVPLLAAQAIGALDWRDALRVLAGGVVVIGLGAAFVLRRAPASGASPGARPGATLGEALRDRRFWWFYAFTLLSAPAMFIPFAHVSAAARDLGIGDTRAVGLVGLIGIGSLVGRFAIGALADRLGRTLTLTLMQASLGLSYGLWLAAGGYLSLAVFAVWFGLSYGGIVSLMPAICMDTFGARAVSSIVGTLYTGAALGNLLGPVVAGAVFDRMASYAPVLWGCVVLAALATAAASRLVHAHARSY
jgi:MCP family monocarboxylic acid transporter-like MFS transporter 13